MRFVSLVTGLVAKARRAVTQAASVSDEKDVVEQLRQTMLRVNKLEAAQAPEAVEFEVNCGTLGFPGGDLELVHNLNGPVRWYVVSWSAQIGGAAITATYRLIHDVRSTPDILFLRSYVSGKAVIRVEPSQAMIEIP